MKNYKYLIAALSLTLLVGCSSLRNIGVGVGESGTVSTYNNLDRHGAIALFQSQEGRACYDNIKEALQFSIVKESQVQRGGKSFASQPTTEYGEFASMAKSMERLAAQSMKYASHMVAYSNGMTPQDPIVQLAALCKRNNYYDAQMANSEQRHETYRKIAGDVKETLLGVSPYAALGYVASKVGDRNVISGNNNALGDDNAVATPTIVEQPDPVRPEVVVVEPEIVIVPETPLEGDD